MTDPEIKHTTGAIDSAIYRLIVHRPMSLTELCPLVSRTVPEEGREEGCVFVRVIRPDSACFAYRPETITGLASVYPFILRFFVRYQPPTLPKTIPRSQNHWIFLSHGIAGNADSYSHLAYSLAAQGYTVCLLEHEDGSASFARYRNGKPIPCVVHYGTTEAEIRSKVRRMIRRRTRELVKVIHTYCPSDCSYTLIGHSFGASTVVCALSQELTKQPKKVLLYDVWMEAVEYFYSGSYNPHFPNTSCFGDNHNYTVPNYEEIFDGQAPITLAMPLFLVYSGTFKLHEEAKVDAFFDYIHEDKRMVTRNFCYGLHHSSMAADSIFLLPACVCRAIGFGTMSMFETVLRDTRRFLAGHHNHAYINTTPSAN